MLFIILLFYVSEKRFTISPHLETSIFASYYPHRNHYQKKNVKMYTDVTTGNFVVRLCMSGVKLASKLLAMIYHQTSGSVQYKPC